MRAWPAALVFVLSAAVARAESPNLYMTGRVTCETWLSNPANERDGENWVYGFWDGLVQSLALGHPGYVGELPNVDLMLDDVRSNCKEKPFSTLAESASRTFEKARQGAFDNPPPAK